MIYLLMEGVVNPFYLRELYMYYVVVVLIKQKYSIFHGIKKEFTINRKGFII